MNILLVGYGNMGKEIEALAKTREHKIVEIVDAADDLEKVDVSQVDVAIEFSIPQVAVKNITILAEKEVDTVVGTTGWYDQLPKVRKIIHKSGTKFLWSGNFSIGVNLFFQIVENAAKLINKSEEYDIWGTEIHHKNKADSPSGTAKILEEILLKNIDRKEKVVEDKLNRKIEDNAIHFSSTRGGIVNFGHTIGFDSASDCIKIEHTARNRGGYVLGAVKCAEWLVKQNPGFYGMEEFIMSND